MRKMYAMLLICGILNEEINGFRGRDKNVI